MEVISQQLLFYDADDAASTDVPRAFGSLKLWLDANDTANMDTGYAAGSSQPPNNGQVGFWKDKSGNNNHAVARNNSLVVGQPIRQHLGGRPTLHFNGKYMTVTNSASGFDNWNKMTVFAVIDEQSASTWRWFFSKAQTFNSGSDNAWSL